MSGIEWQAVGGFGELSLRPYHGCGRQSLAVTGEPETTGGGCGSMGCGGSLRLRERSGGEFSEWRALRAELAPLVELVVLRRQCRLLDLELEVLAASGPWGQSEQDVRNRSQSDSPTFKKG